MSRRRGWTRWGKSKFLENIRAYQQAQNAAILMVTHSMEDVARHR